jgi:NhaP-type Na+/H+ or K+/H+ antiporter
MAGLILGYSLVARRLTLANITAPILSLLAGLAVFSVSPADVDAAAVHLTAELALVVVLFHDASTVRLSRLREDPGLAMRLLLIGFPLALVATFVATNALLPTLGVAGAWLIAAAVTPTDAGLGAPTILNPKVPVSVRRGLNVESGLNDGLATPIVLLALSALAESEGVSEPGILQVGVVPVAQALLLAATLGPGTAWLMDGSRTRQLSSRRGRDVAMLVLPLVLFGLAEVVGANAFIAAFLGGLFFGASSSTLHEEPRTSGLLEVAADLLGFVVWFFAGGILLVVFGNGLEWEWVLLSVLVLTVLRMVPVLIALLGTGFAMPTVAFIGWFGPRGLASIVFGLLALEELGSDSETMRAVGGVITVTVMLSVFAHGVSAGPLSRVYGDWARRTGAPIMQQPSVEPAPTRGRHGN